MVVSGIPFLTSVDAKLSMADEHLQKLEGSFKSIGESDGYSIAFQHNADSTEVAAWIKFEPPRGVRWGAIIGNFADDLRNSLDHMVYAIAVGESGQYPPPDERRLQFPIANTDGDWKSERSRIRTLSDPAKAAIKAEQPFVRRQGDELVPLSVLGALNDRDKHRTILVGASLMNGARFEFPGPIKPAGLQNVLAARLPVVDKAPLVIFRFTKPNPSVAVNLTFSFGVVLNIDGVWCPALAELTRIRDEVLRVVAVLRPFVK